MTTDSHSMDDLVATVAALSEASRRPLVVGISGYGGAGKSTTANWLASKLESAYRLRGDDFLDPRRSHVRSAGWSGVERERLVDTVLRPFRAGQPVTFQRFDWTLGQLARPEALPEADVVIVDAVGLFHPITEPFIDLAIWIDVDAETATRRGKARDRALGRDHDELWDEVWAPNDADFDSQFRPRARADIVVPNP